MRVYALTTRGCGRRARRWRGCGERGSFELPTLRAVLEQQQGAQADQAAPTTLKGWLSALFPGGDQRASERLRLLFGLDAHKRIAYRDNISGIFTDVHLYPWRKRVMLECAVPRGVMSPCSMQVGGYLDGQAVRYGSGRLET